MSKYFVDVFADVVALVREQWDENNNLAPYYLHGHPLEILNTLSARDKSEQWKYRKYPLIALFQDFTETKGENASIEMIVSPRIIIAEQTKSEFDSEDRYNKTFKPVLYPIYDLLLQSMSDSGFFDIGENDFIPHTKTDRLYWGREGLYGNEATIFNDRLDAIDITFNDLAVFYKGTC